MAIQAYIRLKSLTGMSRGDLLHLQPQQNFREVGIHCQRHKTRRKTGKHTIYEWDDTRDPDTGELIPGALRKAVNMALAARTAERSQFLFCNRRGECYVNEEIGEARGWRSMWQRFMARVLKETKVMESFTEHDLRAKVASDAETLEHARALLARRCAHHRPHLSAQVGARQTALQQRLNCALRILLRK